MHILRKTLIILLKTVASVVLIAIMAISTTEATVLFIPLTNRHRSQDLTYTIPIAILTRHYAGKGLVSIPTPV